MKCFISKIVKSYSEKMVRIHASSAAFYIVVSALPLIFVLVYILSFLSPVLQGELEHFFGRLLPKDFYNGFIAILTAIKKKRLLALVPFTLFTALWGSTKGIGGLCYGTESIYNVKKPSYFVLRWLKALWRTLAFYLAIILSLLVFALGRLIPTPTTAFVSILLSLRVIIFAVALSLFFAFFFSRLGNSPLKYHLPGGIFSALGWMLFTLLYSVYVNLSLDSSGIYSEMGVVIFFMLWVYFCVNIILIGAIINSLLIQKSPHSKSYLL